MRKIIIAAAAVALLAGCGEGSSSTPNNLPVGRKVANDPDSRAGSIYALTAFSVPGGCIYSQFKTGMAFAPFPCSEARP